jgi:hypothetical protein
MKAMLHLSMFIVAAVLFAVRAFGYGNHDSKLDLQALGLAVLSIALMPW